ncbi:MAG: hypothetical protein HQL33_06570, partial [Alphaproteobacteria bacterium]|nr:hypothetical protein [Alphaproteobacteria bacterium]
PPYAQPPAWTAYQQRPPYAQPPAWTAYQQRPPYAQPPAWTTYQQRSPQAQPPAWTAYQQRPSYAQPPAWTAYQQRPAHAPPPAWMTAGRGSGAAPMMEGPRHQNAPPPASSERSSVTSRQVTAPTRSQLLTVTPDRGGGFSPPGWLDALPPAPRPDRDARGGARDDDRESSGAERLSAAARHPAPREPWMPDQPWPRRAKVPWSADGPEFPRGQPPPDD